MVLCARQAHALMESAYCFSKFHRHRQSFIFLKKKDKNRSFFLLKQEITFVFSLYFCFCSFSYRLHLQNNSPSSFSFSAPPLILIGRIITIIIFLYHLCHQRSVNRGHFTADSLYFIVLISDFVGFFTAICQSVQPSIVDQLHNL